MTTPQAETLAKVEVLADLEPVVHELMEAHEAKRVLWFPSELLAPPPGYGSRPPSEGAARARARESASRRASRSRSTFSPKKACRTSTACSPPISAATASGRSGRICGPRRRTGTARCSTTTRATAGVLDNPVLERMQFEYLKAGFEPAWDKDPYRVFVYTTLQERATQVSHANTGKLAARVRADDRRRCWRTSRRKRRGTTRSIARSSRPCWSAIRTGRSSSAAEIMPSIDMPGVNMPHFREMADVIRRAGIYGPRDYLKIVEEQIKYWAIEAIRGLDDIGARAQEKILGVPKRLERIADAIEARSRAKTFSFAVAFGREFRMD